jgi:FAD/FMN-containing dehydrogenase
MTTTPELPLSLAGLRGCCEVHLPGDPTYDDARRPWNVAIDQRPAAVAVPRSVAEVVAVVSTAAALGLRVAPQTTGHAAAALAEQALDDAVLLRLSALAGVTVDPVARTARVLGGTVWASVVEACAPHGLTALHGSAGDVGVAGYLLGGGISFYGRRHGVAANSVRSIDLVTADGRLLRASAEENSDLFWALRGGGGSYGVVVAVEIGLLPYPDVVAGMLLWDRDRAAEVVAAWVEWTRTAPESATTTLRIMSFPPLPDLPPFLSGRDLVVIDGAVLEDDATAVDVLARLRALEPEIDTFGRIPAAGLLAVHMDPPGPTPAVTDHSCLGPLDDTAVATLLGRVGPGTESGLLFTELRHLGGAFGRGRQGAGVLATVPGEFALHCVAIAPTPQAAVAGKSSAFSVIRALSPWSVSQQIPTFTDAAVDAARLYPAVDLERLRGVRRALDPAGRVVAHQSLAVR